MTINRFVSNIIKFIFIISLLSFSLSCDNDETTIVPEIPVYVELNLNDELVDMGVDMLVTIIPDSANKNFSIIDFHDKKHKKRSISWKTYGNGLILYRRNFYDYQVYDRTCTYKAFEVYCRLKVDQNLGYAVCPCCSSEFLYTFNGGPSNTSKATKPLVQYMATVTNNNTRLIISK